MAKDNKNNNGDKSEAQQIQWNNWASDIWFMPQLQQILVEVEATKNKQDRIPAFKRITTGNNKRPKSQELMASLISSLLKCQNAN